MSKLEWHTISPSDRQLRDVEGILQVQGDRLDFAYLDHWANQLGLVELWRKVRQER